MAYLPNQPASRLGTVSNFTLTAASQATAAFGAQTRQIRIATEAQPAFFEIGDGTPTAAAATSNVIGAHSSEYFSVTPGQRCAVLQAGAAGKLSVTEIV